MPNSSPIPSPIEYKQACSVVKRYRQHVKCNYLHELTNQVQAAFKIKDRDTLMSIFEDFVAPEPIKTNPDDMKQEQVEFKIQTKWGGFPE